MYTPKAIIATVAIMAGVASAVHVTNPATNFTLDSTYPGCVATVSTECGTGCSTTSILSETQNCDQIGDYATGTACNGTVTFDLTAGDLLSAVFISGGCRASCILVGGSCHTS